MRSFVIVLALSGTATAGSLTGRVFGDGRFPEECSVVVDHEPPVSCNGGGFDIPTLADGFHQLTVFGPTFQRAVVEVTISGATDARTIFVEAGRTIFGRVLDKNGDPVADANVLAYDDPPNAIGSVDELRLAGIGVATTSRDGQFVLAGLPSDGALQVKAFDDDRHSIEYLVPPRTGFNGLDLVVARTGKVTGTVANRRKLRSPVVWASLVGTVGKPLMAGVNPQGHFELDAPAGVYDVELDGEHQAPQQVIVVENRKVKTELAAPTSHTDLDVTAPGCMVATLLGVRPHEKVARTQVGIEFCEDDRVSFTGLAPGPYRVCIDGEDSCRDVAVRTAPHQAMRIDQ